MQRGCAGSLDRDEGERKAAPPPGTGWYAWISPLEPIGDVLDRWAEECAVRSADAVSWLVGDIADEVDDRARRSQPERKANIRDDVGTDPWPSPVQVVDGVAVAGPAGTPPLGSIRDDKYALARFRVATARVDGAYDLIERQLCSVLDASPSAWPVHARLAAVRLRRMALRQCCTGNLRVLRLRCRCCGVVQYGPPAGCNSRVCPRCVKKRRREGQARIVDTLEGVAQRRQRKGQAAPRWRFLTLTSPNWSAFRPMRQWLGAAWGRFMRRDVWTDNVRAAVASWETTYTERGWHVHVHAAVDAFLPHRSISSAWASSVFVELANAVGRGVHLVGVPEPFDAVQESIRADGEVRSQFARAARRVARIVDRGRAETMVSAVREASARVVCWRQKVRGRYRIVRDFRAELLALAESCPMPWGQSIKEFRGDSAAAVARELAKYAGKDLGGAQVDDADEWGIAGTPERLAEFVAGTFRWRVLRTYGDAYDRDEAESVGACEDCGTIGELEPDGTEWIHPERAATLDRERRQRSRARRKATRDEADAAHRAELRAARRSVATLAPPLRC